MDVTEKKYNILFRLVDCELCGLSGLLLFVKINTFQKAVVV